MTLIRNPLPYVEVSNIWSYHLPKYNTGKWERCPHCNLIPKICYGLAAYTICGCELNKKDGFMHKCRFYFVPLSDKETQEEAVRKQWNSLVEGIKIHINITNKL